MQSTESLVTVVLNSGLQHYGGSMGDLYVATVTVMQSVMQMVVMPVQGITQGGQPIMSYNFGAKNFQRVRQAFRLLLLIAFGYEAVTQTITGGSTLGKLLLGLRLVPMDPARGRVLQLLLLWVRSALKLLSLYLFQGFPFLLCCLTIFTNGECRTGFDMAVKVRPEFRGRKFSVHR